MKLDNAAVSFFVGFAASSTLVFGGFAWAIDDDAPSNNEMSVSEQERVCPLLEGMTEEEFHADKWDPAFIFDCNLKF